MQSVACLIRDYSASADTCTVEIQGAGIVDLWLDGVKIDPTVPRAYITAGAPAVLSTADVHKLCDAVITAAVPPSQVGQAITKTEQGRAQVSFNNLGQGSVTVSWPAMFSSTPGVTAQADNLAAVTISGVSTTQATFTTTGPANGYGYISWTATGGA